MGAEHDVARLLAAQAIARRAHPLDHVAVANRRTFQLQAFRYQKFFKSQVGHHGGDDGVIGQSAPALPGPGDQAEHLVAVDHTAPLVAKHHAVGVAIKRDADIRAMSQDRLAQGFGVLGTTMVIDVDAGRLDAQCDHFGAQFPQDAGRGLVGRAVGAIDDDFQPVQPQASGEGVLHRLDVASARVVQTVGAAQVARRRQAVHLVAVHEGLDRAFGVVRQLEAVRAEQLDAVVLEGVVRGRDHDAEISPKRPRQVGYGRRRQRTDQDDIHANRDETGGQRRLQEIPRQAGILADHHGMAVVTADELAARRHAKAQGRLRGHRVQICLAAHAVGSKIFSFGHRQFLKD